MCVRISGSEPADAAVKELLGRLHFAVRPALALLSPDGDVIHVQYAKLYPAYHFNGVEMSSWSEALWTSKDLLAMVDRAETRRAADDARLAELAGAKTPEHVLEKAWLLARRARPERARALFERVLADAFSVEAAVALAELHTEQRRPDEARRLYLSLLERAPTHADATAWKHAAARMLVLQVDRAQAFARDGADAHPAYAAALADLEELGKQARDPASRVWARLTLARVAVTVDDHPTFVRRLEPLSKLVDPDEDCPPHWSPAMVLELANLEVMGGGRFEHRAVAHAWAVARCFPDSVEAQRVKHGLLDGGVRTAEPR